MGPVDVDIFYGLSKLCRFQTSCNLFYLPLLAMSLSDMNVSSNTVSSTKMGFVIFAKLEKISFKLFCDEFPLEVVYLVIPTFYVKMIIL